MLYSSLILCMISLPVLSVTCGESCSEETKWGISEINNDEISWFPAASPLRRELCPLHSASTWRVLPALSHMAAFLFITRTEHIYMTFSIVYCYNCFILLFIVVHLLPCLIYKLNSIIDIRMYRKKTGFFFQTYIAFGSICSFRPTLKILECNTHR